MTRYYYTDPLAAAWMARHHGFFIVHPIEPKTSVHSKCRDEAHCYVTANEVKDIDSSWLDLNWRDGTRFYIHPDSEYLLQPQDGDIVIECYGDLTKGYPLQIIGKCVGISEYACRFGDETIYEKGDDFKIIQRNGKPFFWPEVEQ